MPLTDLRRRFDLIRAIILCLPALILPLQAAAETLTIGGTGAALGTMHLLGRAAAEADPSLVVDVLPSIGSTGGIRALRDGVIDIAVTSRPMTGDERAFGLQEFHMADTPLAFITSQAGPLDVAADAVTGIYAAPAATWPDGTPIRIILRPGCDTQYRTLRERFPGFGDAIADAYLRSEVPIAATDQQNIQLATTIEGSFAAATLAQIMTEAPSNLTRVSINGVSPSPQHVADGSYPLSISFYLIAPARPSDLAERFLVFVRSPQAAAILAAAGQSPAHQPAPVH